jgi:hypothetical protein
MSNSLPQHHSFGAAVFFEIGGGRQPVPWEMSVKTTKEVLPGFFRYM